MDISIISKDILINAYFTNNTIKFLGFECELSIEDGKLSDLPFDVDVNINTLDIDKVKLFLVYKFIRYNILSYVDVDRNGCPYYTEYLKFLRTRKINNILSEDIR